VRREGKKATGGGGNWAMQPIVPHPPPWVSLILF